MSTSGTELRGALAQSVRVSDDALVADLADIRSDDAVLSINFVPYARDIRLVADAVARVA